ncbi:MAG TPA: methyltransferase domain-containing protein [Pyrinomonadaceae bacterium]|nr:methyltransferase domain-containing protein [Pyrinomonadaceae bacterium]
MSESEIDIDELKGRIRRRADARRESDGDRTKIDLPAILRNLQSKTPQIVARVAELPPAEVPPPSLQPPFTPRPDKRYHVNDLLRYHDKEFVRNAYRAVLRREPDDEGYEHKLDGLRGGRFTKMDILAGLRFSPEGRDKNVRLEGLPRPIVRRLYRLPALGYLLQLLVGLKSLPILMRHQSQFEAYTQAQHQMLLDHISQVAAHLTGNFSTRLTHLSDEVVKHSAETAKQSDAQRDRFNLQLEQVGALFREHQELMKLQRQLEEEIYALVAKWRAADLQEPVGQGSPSLARGVEESATIARAFAEFYAAFEDQFRGGAEEIKELFRVYLPYLRNAGITTGILDLGCGRGDWLELLREEGFAARGADSNSVLVGRCRERGLDVTEDEVIAHLRGLPDASLGAVTAFHVIEHFPFETLMNLVDEAWRVLKPGGLIIFETPSPENIVVAACNFHSDPTHHKPVFPHTLRFAMSHRGFTDVSLIFLHPVEGSPFARQDLEPLHMWFYGPRDYAVTARKP